MHEYSVVQALLNQCGEVAVQNNASKIMKVVTKIGVMSGIEPHLLQTEFDTSTEGTMCHKAECVINIQKLKLEGKECGNVFGVDEVRYFCTACESQRVKVVEG